MSQQIHLNANNSIQQHIVCLSLSLVVCVSVLSVCSRVSCGFVGLDGVEVVAVGGRSRVARVLGFAAWCVVSLCRLVPSFFCFFVNVFAYFVCVMCCVLSCLVLSLSCLVLSCLVLSCLVLSCLVLSCLVLSCLVLSCLVLSCLVLSCLVLCPVVWSLCLVLLCCCVVVVFVCS